MEELVESLFSKASAYDELRSTSPEYASWKFLAQQMDEAKDRLQSAEFREGKKVSQAKATMDELEIVIKEFDRLKHQKNNLSASLNNKKNYSKALKLKF